jgi:hypothetical protein
MRTLLLFFCFLFAYVCVSAKDVEISVSEIEVAPKIYLNQRTDIYIVLTNASDTDLEGCRFNIEADDGAKIDQVINLPKDSAQRAEIKWVPQKAGTINLKVKLTPPEGSNDNNQADNQIIKTVEVLAR